MRFTIRDLLWLIAISAMAALIWRERLAIKNERELLRKDRMNLSKVWGDVQNVMQILASRSASLDPRLQAELRNAMKPLSPPLSESERDQIKRNSAALGAPQPVPLPPGFGETPN